MSKTGKIMTVIAMIAAVVTIVAVPGSLYFEEGTDKGTLLWTAAAAAAIAIGFAFASFLFKAAEPKATELRLPEERQAGPVKKKELPKAVRVLLAIVGIGAAGGALSIPSSSYFSGSGPEAIWLLGVIAAVALGLALVHWLLNQGFMNDDDINGDFDEFSAAGISPLAEESGPNYLLWFIVAAVLAGGAVIVNITDLGNDYPVIFFTSVICAMGAGIILAILATRKMDEIDSKPVARDWSQNNYGYEVKAPKKAASPLVRWGAFALLAAAAIAMVAVPTTTFFGEQGEFTIWSFLASGTAMLIGLGLGYWLLQTALAASEKAAEEEAEFSDDYLPPEPVAPQGPTWKRHILLVLSIILAGFTAAVPAAEYYNSGRAYNTGWFLAALSALAVGAMLGYWLKLQAEAAAFKEQQEQDPGEKYKEEKPFVFPPWFKWAVLAGLVVLLVVVAIVGTQVGNYTGSGSSWLEIASAVGAIIGGLGIGIWFTKHFDKMAQDAYEERRKNLSGMSQPTTNSSPSSSYNRNSDDTFERKRS